MSWTPPTHFTASQHFRCPPSSRVNQPPPPRRLQQSQDPNDPSRYYDPGLSSLGLIGVTSRDAPGGMQEDQGFGSQFHMNSALGVHRRTQQLRSDATPQQRNSSQPRQRVMTGVNDHPYFSAPPSITAPSSLDNTPAPPLQTTPIYQNGGPLQQSFQGIGKILDAVRTTSSSVTVELGLLKSRTEIKSLGLSGRGNRLEIIFTKARITGLDYFVEQLKQVKSQLIRAGMDDGTSNNEVASNQSSGVETKYRLNLKFKGMNLGLATQDLESALKYQIYNIKKLKAFRKQEKISARALVEASNELEERKELGILCRAWAVEEVSAGSWIVFFQQCLDSLVGFSSWEAKARVEQLRIPPAEEPEESELVDGQPGQSYEVFRETPTELWRVVDLRKQPDAPMG